MYRMRKYQQDFSSVLSSSNSNMTKKRFLRLFCMSMTLIVVIIPAQLYILLSFIKTVAYPYYWNEVHGPDWGDIFLIPSQGVVSPDHWIQIAVGFLIFGFFGIGQDAQEMYRKWLLHLGFGRFFQSLHVSVRERRRLKQSSSSQTSSQVSRARAFKKYLGRPSLSST